jgi:hypothetical protein
MLRLVHPDDGSNTPARRRHYPAVSLYLAEDEARHARAAIRGVAKTYGSLAKLAVALGVRISTLYKKRPSPGLVLAVARLTGLSVDEMLAGRLVDADRCPSCGVKRPAPDAKPAEGAS